jgi:conjugative transfer signal peptidase TraF
MTQVGRSELARRSRWRDIGTATIGSAVLLGGVLWAGYGCGVRANLSPSLPPGLYIVDPGAAASLVEFCPAQPFGAFANGREYRHVGACADGGSPLLKPVVARVGDTVVVFPKGILVNGEFLPNSAPRHTDTVGRPLTPWPPGTYRVKTGTLWVLSSYHPGSFDSRYFGPILESSVRHRLRPLLVVK